MDLLKHLLKLACMAGFSILIVCADENTFRKGLRPKFNWDRIKFVHAFGDSYSFVYGTQGLANFSFIGDALDFSFTPQQLLSNEIVPRSVRANFYSSVTITDFNTFWETEMTSYFNAVQAATNRGLRTHLFINVPPEERSPSSLGDPTKAALLKTHIDEFNHILADHITAFETSNPDTTVMSFDAHSWFNKVLNDPIPYGFTNTTGYATRLSFTGIKFYI
ncbi:hypothetical protein CVT25_012916 [Psilocybe cyanescens]|uniref:Uncharacterized protein n=1 Tax=Psilocybe cyanescens TaxID=93625 RepID=A0A409XLQ0_PSICY|nr:hypothetical protein CVT25_012916 [Psilocybe cyanescens]